MQASNDPGNMEGGIHPTATKMLCPWSTGIGRSHDSFIALQNIDLMHLMGTATLMAQNCDAGLEEKYRRQARFRIG